LRTEGGDDGAGGAGFASAVSGIGINELAAVLDTDEVQGLAADVGEK
jgi:hypothetical protein